MPPSPYFCQVCFGQITELEELEDSYALPCGHRFCRLCLVSFLESSINNAVLEPKCFFLASLKVGDENKQQSSSGAMEKTGGEAAEVSVPDDLTNEIWEPHSPEKHSRCDKVIPREEILKILDTCKEDAPSPIKGVKLTASNDKKDPPTVEIINKVTRGEILVDRLERFEIMKRNKNARECPSCHLCQVIDVGRKGKKCQYLTDTRDGSGDTSVNLDKDEFVMFSEDVMCENPQCNHIYCFEHSDAHVGRSCEEYRKENAKLDAKSQAVIGSMSKKCPGCSIPVVKMEGAGCNHMKCPDCGCSFCWLCGQEIEDTVFPSHYAYWNLTSRCTNLQMDPNLEVTTWTRVTACITTYGERLILGPLAVISTMVSLLLCCCFVPVLLQTQVDHVQYGDARSGSGARDVEAEGQLLSDHDKVGQLGEMENGAASDTLENASMGPIKAPDEGLKLDSDSKEEERDRRRLQWGSDLTDGPLEIGEMEVSLGGLDDDIGGPIGEDVSLKETTNDEEQQTPSPERPQPSTRRAAEILLGNCMSGWSLIWGTLIVGVPAGLLAVAGGACFLLIYFFYALASFVSFLGDLLEESIKRARRGRDSTATNPLAQSDPFGAEDFAPVPISGAHELCAAAALEEGRSQDDSSCGIGGDEHADDLTIGQMHNVITQQLNREPVALERRAASPVAAADV